MRELIMQVLADSGMKFSDVGRHDPYRNFNFSVDFIGKTAIYKTGWTQVSGIKALVEVLDYKEGGNNGAPIPHYQSVKYEPVTFRRGMSEDVSVLQAFSSSFKNGLGITHDNLYEIIIGIKDRNRNVVRKIILHDAMLSGLELGDLNALGADVWMQVLTASFSGVSYE